MRPAIPNADDQAGREDNELVAKALRGEGKAFHELVDRHAAGLMRLAGALVGNRADAEDVVQETFAGAFAGLAGYRGEASVKTWLTRIAVRQAAACLRKRQRRGELARGQAKTERGLREAPGGQAAADARMDVMAAMDELSPEHREVLVLRELEGLSYDEMAAALALPRGTVESRLFRARRAMQELLKDYLADGVTRGKE
ncbi:MAG: sigma-70 family RNA polymerase sigma factor [Planctomycetota bacterium]|nr:sigma-70 family RNA polymerase sigma factor [Planctomycetota bacterium]